MTEFEWERIRWRIIKYKWETDCKYCKHCVMPYIFKGSYTCRLNNKVPVPFNDRLRGFYSDANPLLCCNGTKSYVF